MFSQRKLRLILGLGVAVALALAVPANASAVPTLTGEHLSASVDFPPSVCFPAIAPYSYTVSGTATGPYPGTFTETGSGTAEGVGAGQGPATLSASFTIHSGNFLISGTKSGGSGTGCLGEFGDSRVDVSGLSYQATIRTSTGNYADQGTSHAFMRMSPFAGTGLAEDFTSSLTAPVLITPTSKDQCKNNGWKNFPQFKNQGECVSSVVSKRPA